jgi:hypothetical protein|tara:strand:+ start:371 stop:502 length:132 start_codon:yes stop_codon:yes gene_type:complete
LEEVHRTRKCIRVFLKNKIIGQKKTGKKKEERRKKKEDTDKAV